ncbi:MAG: hypothetical protein ACK40Q_01760 [Pseudothermotoga sp.]
MRKKTLLLLILLLVLSVFSLQLTKLNTIKIYVNGTVDEKGNMNLSFKWVFPTNALYIQVKNAYPNPYVLVRNMTTFSSIFELSDLKVSYDDAKNSILLDARVIGACASKRQRWEFNLGKGAELIYSDSKQAIFVLVQPLSAEEVAFMTMTLNLPKDSSDFKYDSSTGIFSYSMKRKNLSGKVSAEVNVKVKPRIMASLYKVYGMPEVMDGAYWLAKTVFVNTGQGDIVDLRISYKLGDYTSWSAESVYDFVAPGGAVVDLYYPIISSTIAQLKSQTPCDLQIKYTYKDRSNKTYTDTITKRVQILGINQFEFSNVPEEERTGTWIDNFSNTPLVAAYVTHLDDPVKTFAGMVSQLSGGVAAAAKDQDAIQFCKALYDLAIHNKISYQTPSTFLVEYSSLGQDIKFPRDVLKDKAGTCIDLSILFAAVCQAVSLKSYIVVIPGHAFPVIELPSGDILPSESTGLGGPAVGKSMTFEQAVEAATQQLAKLELGKFFIVNVAELQKQGILPPELPPLPAAIFKDWGYTLPQQTVQQTQPAQRTQPPQQTQGGTPGTAINLSGDYSGYYVNSATGQRGTMELIIQQSGNRLEGDIIVDDSDYGEFTGTISGNTVKITATLESSYYQTQYVVIFTGTIQGNTIQGNYTIQGSNVGGTFQIRKTQ